MTATASLRNEIANEARTFLDEMGLHGSAREDWIDRAAKRADEEERLEAEGARLDSFATREEWLAS